MLLDIEIDYIPFVHTTAGNHTDCIQVPNTSKIPINIFVPLAIVTPEPKPCGVAFENKIWEIKARYPVGTLRTTGYGCRVPAATSSDTADQSIKDNNILCFSFVVIMMFWFEIATQRFILFTRFLHM